MFPAFARRIGCWGIASLLAIAATASAQSENRLDQIKRLNRVAAQRAESDIRDAVDEAVALIKTDPSEALEILDAALHTIENDPALADSQRATLKKLVTARVRDAKAAGGKSTVKEVEPVRRKDAKAVTQSNDDERIQRTNDIRDRLERTRAQIRDRKEQRNDQRRGIEAVSRDADQSALPADKDMAFPKNWKDLVKKRSEGIEMTKAEKQLMKALDTVIEANFDNARFEDVIKYLEDKTGVTILLDKQALEQQSVTYETTVKFKARKVTMRTVLRRILGDVGLAYYIKDEAIQVTSVDRAKQTLTTRAYYIGDLVSRLRIDLGPILNHQQVLDNAKHVIEMVQTNVEPESWSINNGANKIFFDPTRMALIVTATAEVHYMLGGGSK